MSSKFCLTVINASDIGDGELNAYDLHLDVAWCDGKLNKMPRISENIPWISTRWEYVHRCSQQIISAGLGYVILWTECGSQNSWKTCARYRKSYLYENLFIGDARDAIFSLFLDETTVDGQNIPSCPKSFKVDSSCKHYESFFVFFPTAHA